MKPKAKQGCWTCKRRKVGCDKTLPWCSNCVGSGRECLGYGVRLLWPDHRDGRRRDGSWTVNVPDGDSADRSAYYGQIFLNSTFEDVAGTGPQGNGVLVPRSVTRPARSLTLHPPIHGEDAHFLSYYERTISTMISTVQAQNGFRSELLPMALAQSDASASALCHAMMAVAAVHHAGAEAALPFKSRATRFLMDSLSTDDSMTVTETQAAASMMLCVYNVFDETEGHWHLHLDGARNMLQKLSASGGQPSDFLLTWYLYHHVLGCFTRPFRQDSGSLSLLNLIDESYMDKTLIVGSLGCSVELLEAIQNINNLRAAILHQGIDVQDPSIINERVRIDKKLHSLTQTLSADEMSSTTSSRQTTIHTTAEIYRLTALLYLQRVCYMTETDDLSRSTYLTQAFNLLEGLEIASSPWPIFILACESNTDEQRMCILRTLDSMDRARGVGNVFVLRVIIERFWNQCDLKADVPAQKTRMKWWEMINCETAMPWFI